MVNRIKIKFKKLYNRKIKNKTYSIPNSQRVVQDFDIIATLFHEEDD